MGTNYVVEHGGRVMGGGRFMVGFISGGGSWKLVEEGGGEGEGMRVGESCVRKGMEVFNIKRAGTETER